MNVSGASGEHAEEVLRRFLENLRLIYNPQRSDTLKQSQEDKPISSFIMLCVFFCSASETPRVASSF